MTKENSYGIIPFVRTKNGIKYLVVKHNDGHWAFPKGHKKPGETDEEAARRELGEEVGIMNCTIIKAEPISHSYNYFYEGEMREKTVIYYIGEATGEKVTLHSSELSDYKWLIHQEAFNTVTFDNTKTLLEQAYQVVMYS